ncbi:protein of unknown function [Neorhodopirellula lusitana]|uniref:DUF3859 domain-containing protein n=1 Tax=Neorhodopirellula lusitana TaxID=445327 RepID=A0ABY1PRG1_9BACT|nr:DUF3859 domain-containing protein [Neorhodopirellula lusitana]SMP43785.1 protein of unknown function [Neorhodopirellula lusitana]
MAKRRREVRMRTFGIHSKWDSTSKDLPRLVEPTTQVPAQVDIEFGFVVNIKNAKNSELEFCIDHPGILDDQGKRRPPFEGTVYVKSNDWNFYLGDTVWEPIDDKVGTWRMWLELDSEVIADKSFEVFSTND